MGDVIQSQWASAVWWESMCDDYTVPMPVSGGCPAFVAMMGAAFAPIAVAGGVSILACREGERADET